MLTDQHQVLTLVKTFDKLRPYMGHRSFDFSKVLNNELLNLKKSNQLVNDQWLFRLENTYWGKRNQRIWKMSVNNDINQ